jgi:solute carrier family 25 protein 16
MSTNLVRHEDIRVRTDIMSTSATQAQTNVNPSLERHSPICPTDGDTPMPRKEMQRHMAPTQAGRSQKVDKKSPEYLMKSMIAGGIAGCAVCT